MGDWFSDFLATPVEQPRQRKLAAIVASEIADDIFAKGLQPGDPLPHEAEMLKGVDVSRATLREALRILETQGVITIRTGRGGGPMVSRPNPRAVAEALMVNFRALNVSFEEVLLTRDTIEPTLAKQAALNRRDDDIERLTTASEQLNKAHWSDPALLKLNRDFHTAVALASRNRPLAILWSAISTVADGQGVGVQYDERLWAEGNAAHRKILKAIVDQDAEAAERAMSKHVHGFIAELQDGFPELLASTAQAQQRNTSQSRAQTPRRPGAR